MSAEGSVYENRRADNTLSDQEVENVDEPTIKRSRFDTDERDPYGRVSVFKLLRYYYRRYYVRKFKISPIIS